MDGPTSTRRGHALPRVVRTVAVLVEEPHGHRDGQVREPYPPMQERAPEVNGPGSQASPPVHAHDPARRYPDADALLKDAVAARCGRSSLDSSEVDPRMVSVSPIERRRPWSSRSRQVAAVGTDLVCCCRLAARQMDDIAGPPTGDEAVETSNDMDILADASRLAPPS